MGKNLNGNIKYFGDCTYYCAFPQCHGKKLFIIVAFNKILNKTILYALILISNENKETFEKIFIYLKETYKFNLSLFIVDFGKECYVALNNILPQSRVYPCNFHLIS